MKRKILIMLMIGLFASLIKAQDRSELKLTKVDRILDALSLFADTSNKEIKAVNSENNLNLSFENKFTEIDSLIISGVTPVYDKNLIPDFKKAYFDYRAEKKSAIGDLKILMDKGFAPAAYLYANSFKNKKQRNKFLKQGIANCCDVCRIPIMKDEYDKYEKETTIILPEKCYK